MKGFNSCREIAHLSEFTLSVFVNMARLLSCVHLSSHDQIANEYTYLHKEQRQCSPTRILLFADWKGKFRRLKSNWFEHVQFKSVV